MARAVFYFIREDENGNLVLDKNVDTSKLSATKNGVTFSTTFYSNGDGTYYFAPSGSGLYTLSINNVPQDEFNNIFIPDADIITTAQVDGTTIQFTSNRLNVINGATLLRQSDIVNNLASTSSIAPLSAYMGNQLSASIATKEPADSTILKESDIVNDFTTGGVTSPQSAESLKLDLNGTTYLSGLTTYNSALRELDRKIASIQGGGALTSYVPFGYSGSWLHTTGDVLARTIGGADNTYGYLNPSDCRVIGMSILGNVSSFIQGGSALDDYGCRAALVQNGVISTTAYTEFAINSTGIKSDTTTGLDVSIAAGDKIGVKIQKSQLGVESDDQFTVKDISILLEIEK